MVSALPAPLDDPRAPSLAALAVALLLLLASPLVLYPHAGQSQYDHSVERVDRSEVPEEVTVRGYEDLSSEAQRAVDRAITSPDGSATVYGESNRPPEFFYSDYADYGRGIYVIEKQGTYYRLTTSAGGGLFPSGVFETGALVLVAAAVGVAGAAGWRDERRRVPAGFAGGGLAVLALAAAPVPHTGPLSALDPFGLLLAAPLAWLAVGTTHDGPTALGTAAVAAGGAILAAFLLTTGGATLFVGVVGALVVAALVGALGRWSARELRA
jgi:hypothetical protein